MFCTNFARGPADPRVDLFKLTENLMKLKMNLNIFIQLYQKITLHI